MTQTFYIEEGDRSPSISAQLTDEDDNPIDLSSAQVSFLMREPRGGELITKNDANVVDATAGEVEYLWQQADTSEPGRYRAEFIVEYPDGTQESFPNVEYHTVYVTRSLDE